MCPRVRLITHMAHVSQGHINNAYVSVFEKDMRSCDKGRHEPFVELVHSLQVHVVGLPHVLIHQIQRRMRDELVQVSVVILHERHISTVPVTSFITQHYSYTHLRLGLSRREKLHLKHRVIVMTHHNEIKTPRHR